MPDISLLCLNVFDFILLLEMSRRPWPYCRFRAISNNKKDRVKENREYKVKTFPNRECRIKTFPNGGLDATQR